MRHEPTTTSNYLGGFPKRFYTISCVMIIIFIYEEVRRDSVIKGLKKRTSTEMCEKLFD